MSQMRRRRPRGAMTVVVVVMTMVLTAFLVAGTIIGRLSVQRDEHQAQADAIAMTAAQIAIREGVDAVCNHRALQQVAAMNSRQNAQWNCPQVEYQEMPDGTFKGTFTTEVRGALNAETPLLEGNESWNLRTDARSEFSELRFDDAERRYPVLVLVLDYSGSMRAGYGGGRSRIEALRAAVRGLLDLRLPVAYGLVMFNSGVIQTIGVDDDDPQQDILDAIYGRGAGGGTNYVRPMDAAINLLAGIDEETPRNILFISDGEPNEGPGPGINQSDRARARGIKMFTLSVGRGGRQDDVLRRMAGPPGAPGNPDYFYPARNDAALQATFRRIVAEIICEIGPLDPEPAADQEVFAFLYDRFDNEIKLPVENNLVDNADQHGFYYSRPENLIRLTERSCDEVIDNGGRLVIRYGQTPHLVQ